MMNKKNNMSLRKLMMITSVMFASTVTTNMTYAEGMCGKQSTVFSCRTKKNKIIKICQSGNKLTYSFGRKGKTELRLKRTKNTVIKRPWNGVGYEYHHSIGFKQGNTVYSVYASHERRPNGASSGGVIVEHKGKEVMVNCRPHTIFDRIPRIVE